MGGPGFDLFEPNDNYVKVYKPKTGVRPGGIPPHGLPEQAAHAVGRRLRRVRLPRRRPDRAAPQQLHDAAPGAQPAQQPVRAPAGRILRRAAATRKRATTAPRRCRRVPARVRPRAPSARRGDRRGCHAGRASTDCKSCAGRYSTRTSSCSCIDSRRTSSPIGSCHARQHPFPRRPPTARPPRLPALGGTGLGGIALASLLGRASVCSRPSGARRSARPSTRAPLAPRPPHFPAKAKRVLMIFCSGACQPRRHLRLQARTDQAPRQADARQRKLVTFQGEQATSTKPLCLQAARQVRQDGLRPAAAPRANWPTTCASSTR